MAIRSSLNAAYILLAGLVLASILLVFTVLRPMVDEISATRQEISTVETKLAERQAFLQSIDVKQAALDQEQSHERLLSVALPTTEAMDAVSRILHRAAAASGSTILKLNNRSTEEQRNSNARQVAGSQQTSFPENVLPLAMDLEISSNYAQLRAFLSTLERSVRILDVASLEISPENNRPDALRSKISIRFYRHGGSVIP
jgi:Tfp pilus assembly protein PilO